MRGENGQGHQFYRACPMMRACRGCGTAIRYPATQCIACRRAYEAKRGTRTQRGYGAGWAKLSRRVLERDGWICHWCGSMDATTADHVIPKVRGGTDDPANLVASCVRCNSSRGGRGGTPTT